MIRIFAVLLAAAITILALANCGSGSAANGPAVLPSSLPSASPSPSPSPSPTLSPSPSPSPTPAVTEFAIPSSVSVTPYVIVSGPDGALWFTAKDANGNGYIYRLATSGSFTQYSAHLPAGYYPTGITVGPDGALWFLGFNNSNDEIGRITTDGVVTTFPPLGGTTAFGITTGPDGELWFPTVSNAGAGDIEKMTTAGSITSYPLARGIGCTCFLDAGRITKGPDGALWFTGDSQSTFTYIGRITTSGSITYYCTFYCAQGAGIQQGANPFWIVAGPDGAIWFTDAATNGAVYKGAVGRITVDGSFATEFNSGITPQSEPMGLTVGPDGALWFTENAAVGNRISRITTAGVVTEFAQLPTANAGPFAITCGPDGNIWFTEQNAGKIGRLTTGFAPGSCP